MAELTIRPDEIRDALAEFVRAYEPEAASTEEVGIVAECGDGIARVEGLPSAMANELLEFEDGTRGLALNLDVREIGVVILGDFSKIDEGQKVNEPLQTGIKAIDAMTPIGRGQRELIIGDRQTGKTAIAIDTIINQKDNWESGNLARQVKCVYVAVGQKGSTIAQVRQSLEDAGAMEYTTIVAAPASDPAGYKYIAPYTGSAIGQHWMYAGQHVLIILDDLYKHAEAYRAVSLLLRRPPGREAYPGDVFYLHSRLLERCAKLSDDLGGGSMTGLPIIETKGNDVSAYIPTNVISITDGQIYLEPDLFNAGVRPAINVGISVSRVGGSAQIRAMRKVAGTLRIDLAQFRALEAFALFASDLDRASRAQLDRGNRMVELLKQGQYQPMPVERQVISIWAGGNGFLDHIPVSDVRRFERELLDFMEANYPEIGQHIRNEGTLPDEVEEKLREAATEFARRFRSSEGKPAVRDENVEPMDEDEEGQESVRTYRRDTPEEAREKRGPAGQGASGTP